jgi:hypothetical protein
MGERLNGWTRLMLIVLLVLPAAAATQLQTYDDPQKRFTFSYPPAFGAASRGTDDGFRERVAAIRFDRVNYEAVLTQGQVTVDRQALGGLYDTIARQIIPESALLRILQAVTPVTAANFCELLGATDHVARRADLSAKDLQMARAADALGNDTPRVVTCARRGDVIAFHKEAGLAPGGGRRHVFGAIRFLEAPFSSFQIVGIGAAPGGADLGAMRSIAESFTVR